MAKCSFCSRQVEQGRGVTYVAFDRVYNFCSSKCRRNFNLGRESSRLSWIRKSGKKKTKAELKAELLEEAKHKEGKGVSSEEKAETESKKEEAEQEVKAESQKEDCAYGRG